MKPVVWGVTYNLEKAYLGNLKTSSGIRGRWLARGGIVWLLDVEVHLNGLSRSNHSHLFDAEKSYLSRLSTKYS